MATTFAKIDNRISRTLAACALILLAILCTSAALLVHKPAPQREFLLPRASANHASSVEAPTALPSPSTHWTIKHHGQCCEGNLAAEGPSAFLLLPILVTGNQIWKSNNNGVTWTQKYPPANASVPFGIEGDLNAFHDDVVFFGTLVAQGVAAFSRDRGETWTTVPIPVAFPANDQAWGYLGPFSNLVPGQLASYVMAGWYRIGSVVVFSLDGGMTWPIQTPLPAEAQSLHVICEQTAHAPNDTGDTRNPNADFHNHKAGHFGCWGTDRQFYWTEPVYPDLYVCKTNNFGASWTGIKHPIEAGAGETYITSHSGFDNKGTLYVLHGDKLYVSFNQGESFKYVHTLPRFGNAGLSDSGADHWFVVNCGTIHVGIAEAGDSGNTNIWYLRGSFVDTASPVWEEELVDVVGNNRLDFFQIVLNGNNIPIMSYTAPSVEVTTAARDMPLPSLGDSCSQVIIDTFISAVSRKTHGSAGTFDILLPLSGTPGIESRTGGANGDHDIVVRFQAPVTIASASSSCGTVTSKNTIGNETTIHLSGVANASRCAVTLTNVSDGVNSANLIIPVNFLLGDTTADSFVNSTDIAQTKSQSGQNLSITNVRTDVTVDGNINSTDIALVKSKSGTALP
jgi:hypothetical protein